MEAQNNLGSVLMEQGRLEESLACFEQVLCQNAGHVEAHFNRAILWLLQGDWAQGWPEYEWRWQAKPTALSTHKQPRWDGSRLEGRKLLLVAEQGLGDTLQFIRYAPLLKERGATIIVYCQKAFLRLLKTMPGIDALVPEGCALPPFDVYAPLMSLPGILQTTPDTVPANVPYLSADAELCEQWRRELSLIGGFKIGIAWQGNTTYKRDKCRSIPYSHFEPLGRLPGVRLLSLQKGHGDLGSRIDEAAGPFMDTSAIMKNLDLVITSDTAIAHLAGRWVFLFGWHFLICPIGAGCSNARIAPGIPPCVCFARLNRATGKGCSSGSRPSYWNCSSARNETGPVLPNLAVEPILAILSQVRMILILALRACCAAPPRGKWPILFSRGQVQAVLFDDDQ